MATLGDFVTQANRLLQRFDVALIRRSSLEALRDQVQTASKALTPPALPEEARIYLRSSNPRLVELSELYRQTAPEVMQPSRWTADYIERRVDLANFRSDNAYVFHDRNTESTYVLTANYLSTIDPKHLLGRLEEDGLFGATTFEYKKDAFVSRDLLDSIVEIYSLLDHLQESDLSGAIVDIGAGYGRFAHRATQALPFVKCVYCTDVIPTSTFLCEYYLSYRRTERAIAVPFSAIENVLKAGDVKLAVNIHSFSECPWAAVDWWIRLLRQYEVQNLFLVPNPADHGGTRLLTQELDGTHRDYSQLLASYGYKQTVLTPKYGDDVLQRLGVSPTHHHFYRLATPN